jgi:hypothetical protein
MKEAMDGLIKQEKATGLDGDLHISNMKLSFVEQYSSFSLSSNLLSLILTLFKRDRS